MSDLTLQEFVEALAREQGPDLRGYKCSTLERRVRKSMQAARVAGYREYLERIREDAREGARLLDAVLINVTEFFRDPQAWEYVRAHVLPPLLSALKPGDSFRAWSAGCASGEEPYSLAILLAEFFGDKLPEIDIKIYATDVDEEALQVARRGEYPADRLRRMRAEWRERYFAGVGQMRINRELRRMVIFGRSGLSNDAPISHCQLVMCRNVLIYFDGAAQRQVLARLHYAVEPGGYLFLGKAETKMMDSQLFYAVNARWRIFQRPGAAGNGQMDTGGEAAMADIFSNDKAQQEVLRLRQFQIDVLAALRPAVIVLDNHDLITAHNDAAVALWGVTGMRLTGKRLQNSELVARSPEIAAQMETLKAKPMPITFPTTVRIEGLERQVAVTLRPILDSEGRIAGSIIYGEDVTDHGKLQGAVEQLEATSEELQSSNEELETTNEELQSTNEELETTNEELQSTNEELETTNEELQSLNEELENMNEELEHRTQELNVVNNRYAETLQSMPWPVVLVDHETRIQLWNTAAKKLFGVAASSVIGVNVESLPLHHNMRNALVRRVRQVLDRKRGTVLREQSLRAGERNDAYDVHLTPVAQDGANSDGVLVMFSPCNLANNGKTGAGSAPARRAGKRNNRKK